MASDIDPTVIKDNQKVSKQDLRDQLETAANEITALQLAVTHPRRMMFDDTLFKQI